MAGRPSQKSKILEAAGRVVAGQGAAHLTLDAVAAEADISKGGLLYHFPNKRHLLQGMLQRLLDATEERTQDHIASTKPNTQQPGILAAQLAAGAAQTTADHSIALAIIAAVAEDPELVAPAQRYLSNAYAQATSTSSDPFMASLLSLSSFGLTMMEILNVAPLNADQAGLMRQRMLQAATQLGPTFDPTSVEGDASDA